MHEPGLTNEHGTCEKESVDVSLEERDFDIIVVGGG